MDTLLNKNDWFFINNLNSSNLEKEFELLIKKYLKIAIQPETAKILPDRKKINYLNTIINKNAWIYSLTSSTNDNKMERYTNFFNYLYSIGMLNDYYKLFGKGIVQDRNLVTCYVKLANKQFEKLQEEKFLDKLNIDKVKDYIILKDKTSATIGFPFTSKIIIE